MGYIKNIDGVDSNNREVTDSEKVLRNISYAANYLNNGLKSIRGTAAGFIRDDAVLREIIPAQFRTITADAFGSKNPITNSTFSRRELSALSDIVHNAVSKGKMHLSYDDYRTSKNGNDDVGGMLTSIFNQLVSGLLF